MHVLEKSLLVIDTKPVNESEKYVSLRKNYDPKNVPKKTWNYPLDYISSDKK